MMQRRILGFVLGGAVLAAVVVPATADAREDAAPPAEAVTVQTVDPGALEDQPTSSDGQAPTGAPTPTSTDAPAPAPGGPEEQLVIGPDNRTKVNDTTTYPARAVALIVVNPTPAGDPTFSCTGWLISPDTVATAAHCLYYEGAAVYTVTPGWDGDSGFASCSVMDAVETSNSWFPNGDGPIKDDYAALDLNEDVCPDYTDLGFFGFRQVADAKIKGLEQKLSGYPDDKGGEQWKSSGKIRRANPNLVFYKNDTRPGMSGSPVYRKFNGCGTCAVAIHTSSYGTVANPIENGGTRIRPEVGQFLNTIAVPD